MTCDYFNRVFDRLLQKDALNAQQSSLLYTSKVIGHTLKLKYADNLTSGYLTEFVFSEPIFTVVCAPSSILVMIMLRSLS